MHHPEGGVGARKNDRRSTRQISPADEAAAGEKAQESPSSRGANNADDRGKEKKEKRETWQVQGISEIKASLISVKNRLDYIEEEFYEQAPPGKTKGKSKANAAATLRAKDGDIPTLVNSGLREVQINDDGTARKRYGPRPNENKNNIGQVIETSKEEVKDEVDTEKKKKSKKRKKKRKAKLVGRLVRLQRQYARKPRTDRRPREGWDSSLAEGLIARLEYLRDTRQLLVSEQCRLDADGYQLREIGDGTGQLALITRDGIYGIGAPAADNSHDKFRPLKLPVVDVNAGLFQAREGGENGEDQRQAGSVLSLPQIDGSLASVKKYLQALLGKDGQERTSNVDCQKMTRATLPNVRHDGLSSPRGVARRADRRESGGPACDQSNAVASSLRISSIRALGALPEVDRPNDRRLDAAAFGRRSWPRSFAGDDASRASRLLPVCSEPPPTTPESNVSEPELDKSHDAGSVILRDGRPSNSDGRRTRRYAAELLQTDACRRQRDIGSLHLDVVRKSIRERISVKEELL